MLISSTKEKTKKIKFRKNAQNHQIEMINHILIENDLALNLTKERKKSSKRMRRKTLLMQII